MDRAANEWRAIFEQWPRAIPRQGMLLTSFQETIPFVDFRVADGALLLQRDRPDSHGARKIFMTWSAIDALKLADAGELSTYDAMGFAPHD